MFNGSRRVTRLLLSITPIVLLAACATQPEVLSENEIASRVDGDLQRMFANAPTPGATISLAESIARAIKYNLDNRLKLMESVVASRRLDAMDYEKLPQLAMQAGFSSRDRRHIARSRNVDLGGLETNDSTSQDKDIGTADLQTSWNTLDFGIAYLNSKQTADQVLISVERQRKIVHNIVKDVRYAYWRMISAQRLQGRLTPLITDIRGAMDDALAVSNSKLSPNKNSLEYQRTLLDLNRQMVALQRDLEEAKIELTALMGLPTHTDFHVQTPSEYGAPYRLDGEFNDEELEMLALHNRPELLEEDYRTRIALTEIKKQRWKMIPGLELFTGYNYNDNSFLRHQSWAQSGIRLTWNLMNIINAPARIRYAKSEKELADIRRMALAMAVLTQVDIALLRVEQAQQDFGISREMFRVDGEINDRDESYFIAKKGDRLSVIRSRARRMLSELRYLMSYAEWHNAIGQLYSSVGYQPASILDYTAPLPELSEQVAAYLQAPAFSSEDGFFSEAFAKKDLKQAEAYMGDDLHGRVMSTVENEGM